MIAGCTACEKEQTKERIELLNAANARLDSAIAQRMEMGKTNIYNAQIVPAFIELGFEEEGYLYGLYVSPGLEVEEGEVLATLVSRDYDKMKELESTMISGIRHATANSIMNA